MADNRMILYHRPTGESIVLAKCYSTGWVAIDDASALQGLFQRIEDKFEGGGSLQDFVLLMEHTLDGGPFVHTNWRWEKDVDGDGYHPKLLTGSESPRPAVTGAEAAQAMLDPEVAIGAAMDRLEADYEERVSAQGVHGPVRDTQPCSPPPFPWADRS